MIMPIKILPARLANQIAAGEVVERPASVVKELVENSLDSGATRIDIDIEKGGTKLIRIRDNGHGIDKDELTLALSRHATSKIHTLDDLEAIMSLGFRGEALASISSVSRLSLISRTATQEQAWLAYSEGRDMAVTLQPTAHPIGTTVEVLDLFFNTPARRKFLRTEKTEFGHIDELIKRIALSRFDVSIVLRHNGAVLRQYRASKTDAQVEKRIASACGAGFVRHMLKIELEHQGLTLRGWLADPNGARQQSDLQYCYVNGRMMKDKLINHAIRQSFEHSLSADQFPAYVLYIEIDPHQVDVNVHPAKHEVRFHQARLVHDFIYQAVASALAQAHHIEPPSQNQAAFHYPNDDETSAEAFQADDALEKATPYSKKPAYQTTNAISENARHAPWLEKKNAAPSGFQPQRTPTKKESAAYQTLMNVDDEKGKGIPDLTPQQASEGKDKWPDVNHDMAIDSVGKAIAIVENHYLLTLANHRPYLISLVRAQWLRVRKQLDPTPNGLRPQPLLVPLTFNVLDDEHLALGRLSEPLKSLGIDIKSHTKHKIMVMSVPQPLRQQNLQLLLPNLISYAASLAPTDSLQYGQILADWLADHVILKKDVYTLSEAIQLIAELEQLWQGLLPLEDTKFIRPADFSTTIAVLRS
jgi:DNA mismatch repair protein MutL